MDAMFSEVSAGLSVISSDLSTIISVLFALLIAGAVYYFVSLVFFRD